MEAFLIIFVTILIIIFMVPNMRCPKCERSFSRKQINREEDIITYRCKYCDYVWKEHDDGSIPPTYPF